MEAKPPEPDPYLDELPLVGIPQVSVLTTLPDSACARGTVSATYGQNLYISDVSDDEVGAAFVGRKRRSRHIRAPAFADQFMEIIYDCTEDYITVSEDVITYRQLPGIIAVSLRMRNDSFLKEHCCSQ